jgi:hypothetical protein
LSHRYCYLPLSWKSWKWFECAVGGVHHPQHTQTDCFTWTGNSDLYCKWSCLVSKFSGCQLFLKANFVPNLWVWAVFVLKSGLIMWFFWKNIWCAQPVSLALESYCVQCW